MMYLGYTLYLHTVCDLLKIPHEQVEEGCHLQGELYEVAVEHKLAGSGLVWEYLDKGVYILGVKMLGFRVWKEESCTPWEAVGKIQKAVERLKLGLKKAGITMDETVEIAQMEDESIFEKNPEPTVISWSG